MYRKIVCEKLSTNFRECTRIMTAPLPKVRTSRRTRRAPCEQSHHVLGCSPQALNSGSILVKNEWCGINASDINFTNGKYMPGVKPPFDCGFEAMGKVAKVGENVTKLKEGDSVVYTSFGAFSEYQEIDARAAVSLPKIMPEALPLFVSGLTASIALEQVGEIKKDEIVLVTAAAGGTGSFAVQLAKQAGCHVIGTCSSDEKVEALKALGCDRPVNYKKEDLFQVLRSEYSDGVNVVYESVGASFFDIALNNLAKKGWSQEGGEKKPSTPITAKLLGKSASIRGFFLNDYTREWKPHMAKLLQMTQEGKLKSLVDQQACKQFNGLESIPDAIEYMYEGKNIGKVLVKL
ncbi:hypothetical protein GUITHDRAFT_162662 [Guillardia theta CCMP2712]|uniref:Enoyl reductase (ER) domain-containing protein n=1 Tax=Guillardia theta (strain CCMP2712) TaxID=905079 RepID=L1JGJ5_GUITC|nr:hypothetical protein GUITHDRAFT_162662 [Guillardia theta CCMP2712]EKX47621.1 hypothetical protein GUITHDRAFT_162662 [Guillardia theta CCMP2712]|eukprot:XP_005834601.1 hypothetical protein GUITHDRAFT_162662 [Guillardia theta CCMP2712]